MLDLKAPRTQNCIIIDTENWKTSTLITLHRMSARTIPTYITDVVDVNPEEDCLKELVNPGDTVAISRAYSEIAQYKAYKVLNRKYFNVPITQLMGTFKDNNITYEAFTPLLDKILVEKVEVEGLIKIPNDNSMVGRVLKIGTCRLDEKWNKRELSVKVGDLVLLRDNISTKLNLDGKDYYATSEDMVLGILKNDVPELGSLEIINKYLVVHQYVPEKALNSILLTPDINYEDADYTDIYNRFMFKVDKLDNSIEDIEKDDVVFADFSLTNYAYLGHQKLIVLDRSSIQARLRERE